MGRLFRMWRSSIVAASFQWPDPFFVAFAAIAGAAVASVAVVITLESGKRWPEL